MNVDTIITAGTVITVDAGRTVLSEGAVAIDDGAIVGIGATADVLGEFTARTTLHKPHGIMLPGLIDTHSHAGHGLIRTMADDLNLWMDACDRVYRHGATPEFWFAEGRLTAAERLLAGTTTSLSMLGGAGDTVRSDSPDHGRAHIAAYSEIGLRTMVVIGPGAPPFPKHTTDHQSGDPLPVTSDLAAQLATVAALEVHARRDPLSTVATTFTTLRPDAAKDPEVKAAASEVRALADDLGLRIVQDGHTSDTVRASEHLGLLGKRTILSHATDLDGHEIDLIAQTGASVAHNPSAIFSQYGRCPVPELMDAGVAVGLGSDATAPDRSADMFRHMFQLTRYHRATRQDPTLFPPGLAIDMATISAARVLGMDHLVGSLEVGKRADIIVVDADRPHLTPTSHPVHQLVYFATGADVETVIVDGRILLEDGLPLDLDLPTILTDARHQQELAFARVGLDHPGSSPDVWGSNRQRP